MRDLVSDCEICHARSFSCIQTNNHVPRVRIPVDHGFHNKPHSQRMTLEFRKFIQGAMDSLQEFWSHDLLHWPGESDVHEGIFTAAAVMCGPVTIRRHNSGFTLHRSTDC